MRTEEESMSDWAELDTRPTLHSDGRWFGWDWTAPIPNTGMANSGYAFTQWGARHAVRRVLARRARGRTTHL